MGEARTHWWQPITRLLAFVGRCQSAFLLYLVYLVCWIPVGLLTRMLADWLHWRAPVRSNWWLRAPRMNDPSHVKDPF